jgi:threonine dehydrogenase-like Zn-dependent dehydrogenase
MLSSSSSSIASCWVFTDSSQSQELQHDLSLKNWELESGEVFVSLRCAAVCGSDVHTCHGKRVDPAAPLVLGHEGMGTVIASARVGIAVGAVISWASCVAQCEPVASCEACSEWAVPQKCARIFKYGHAPWPREAEPTLRAVAEGLSGCFATHILLRRNTNIVPLHDALAEGVPDGALASANCAASTGVAAWRTAQRHLIASSRGTMMKEGGTKSPPQQQQRKLLVFGAGLVGLYVIAAAKADGAIVTAVDISPDRLALAQLFGADFSVCTTPSMDTDAIVAAVVSATGINSGGDLFDAAIEVCGLASIVPPALKLLRFGGTIIVAGMVFPNTSLSNVTGEALIRKCATLVGLHNYEGIDLIEAIDLIRKLHARFPTGSWERLFSPPLLLNDLPEALALATSGKWARVLLKTSSQSQ